MSETETDTENVRERHSENIEILREKEGRRSRERPVRFTGPRETQADSAPEMGVHKERLTEDPEEGRNPETEIRDEGFKRPTQKTQDPRERQRPKERRRHRDRINT